MRHKQRVKQETDALLHLNERLWKMDRDIAKHDAYKLDFDRTNIRERNEIKRIKAERDALRMERDEIAWTMRDRS